MERAGRSRGPGALMLTYETRETGEEAIAAAAPQVRPRRAASTFARRAIAVLALAGVFFGVLLVRMWMSDSGASPAGTVAIERPMPTSPAIESTYGVRFVGVDVTSGGGMIQVRYQVLDTDKAGAIHDEEATPTIIDASGTAYNLPGMPGHTHIGPVKKAGTTDFVLLANARGGVKPGSTVTLRMGELELRNVPVS